MTLLSEFPTVGGGFIPPPLKSGLGSLASKLKPAVAAKHTLPDHRSEVGRERDVCAVLLSQQRLQSGFVDHLNAELFGFG